MMCIGLPGRPIIFGRLIAPGYPSFPLTSCKQLKITSGTASLDDSVLFIGLAGMFALASSENIHLSATRSERACVLAAHAKQDQLGDIAEIETNSAAIRAAILAHFVPDDVGFVIETPRLHNGKALGQHSIRAPEIQVRSWRNEVPDWKRHDLVEPHRTVARQALVLGGHFAGLVSELPRRIGEDSGEALALCKTQELSAGIDAPIDSGNGFSGAGRNVEQFRLTGVFALPRLTCATHLTTVVPLSLRHSSLRRFQRRRRDICRRFCHQAAIVVSPRGSQSCHGHTPDSPARKPSAVRTIH